MCNLLCFDHDLFANRGKDHTHLHPIPLSCILELLIIFALRWEVPIMRPGPNWGHLALKMEFLFKCEQILFYKPCKYKCKKYLIFSRMFQRYNYQHKCAIICHFRRCHDFKIAKPCYEIVQNNVFYGSVVWEILVPDGLIWHASRTWDVGDLCQMRPSGTWINVIYIHSVYKHY